MINLIDILKDCPKGTKLYSTTHGYISFDCIELCNEHYPIYCHNIHGTGLGFTKDGKYHVDGQGECVLFPSKENRDWSKFQRPFKDGDIVFYNNIIAIFKEWCDKTSFRTYCSFYTNDNNTFLFEVDKPLFGKSVRKEIRFATEEEKQKLFDVIKVNGYKWNPETKTLEKIVEPKFKVGDRVKKNKDYISGIVTDIFDDSFKVTYDSGSCCYVQFHYQCDWELVRDVPKFKVGDKFINKVQPIETYIITYVDLLRQTYHIENIKTKQSFDLSFDYEQYYEIVPNKFDIKTLKPFDKVLVRDKDTDVWKCDFFSHIIEISILPFRCVHNSWNQCIPYEGNEHLVGTINNCDDYYKN